MRVGLLGTGAIAEKHAQAYANLGFEIVACANRTEAKGRAFAERWNTTYVRDVDGLCRIGGIDYVDVCTFPDSHLTAVSACASSGISVLLQKPVATSVAAAQQMVRIAEEARIVLGVVSQHRFDDCTLFLKAAIAAGRLGRILQADAYVKWFRSDDYYARPIKGSWAVEGGGALINQAIHQADLLLHLVGPVSAVQGMWQLGALHRIESEDILNALLRYSSGATGVLQAATAFWPGYAERIELHGTKGTAVISGDQLVKWDVLDDGGHEPAPVRQAVASGSSDPMAIGLTAFERQFADFGRAVREGSRPNSDGVAGMQALQLVTSIYEACRTASLVQLTF